MSLLRLQVYLDSRIFPMCDSLLLYFSPVLVLFGFALIGGLFYVGVFVLLPFKSAQWKWVHLVAASFMIVNLFSRYILAVFTDPGTIPDSSAYKLLILQRAEHLDVDLENTTAGPLAWNKCKRTGVMRPPRARYCQILKTNVMNYDHYCPWIFNAVGYQNLRHFVVFLFWVWLSTMYGALFSIDIFFSTWGHNATESR